MNTITITIDGTSNGATHILIKEIYVLMNSMHLKHLCFKTTSIMIAYYFYIPYNRAPCTDKKAVDSMSDNQ